jgi:hypothetical protein
MLWWGFIIWVVCVNTSTPKTNLFLLSPHPICTIHPATLLAGWLKTPHTDKCQRDVTPSYPPSPLLITRQMEKRKQKERLQSLLSQDENDLTLILPSIYLSSHRVLPDISPHSHRHCIGTIITIAPTTQAPFAHETRQFSLHISCGNMVSRSLQHLRMWKKGGHVFLPDINFLKLYRSMKWLSLICLHLWWITLKITFRS